MRGRAIMRVSYTDRHRRDGSLYGQRPASAARADSDDGHRRPVHRHAQHISLRRGDSVTPDRGRVSCVDGSQVTYSVGASPTATGRRATLTMFRSENQRSVGGRWNAADRVLFVAVAQYYSPTTRQLNCLVWRFSLNDERTRHGNQIQTPDSGLVRPRYASNRTKEKHYNEYLCSAFIATCGIISESLEWEGIACY
jgi:hypothetical protein